ncbi:MAG: nickel-responsive transcriptional regulator NikR [Bacteroidales bacterium]|jgi:CopG family nickel-responsive transcriptional regulator|nr:nickel-responsive transcriptional regulator NikR [Bacteroidales bacterium]
MAVVRFGVSLEQELLDALDNFVTENHFANRSQAIRHMIANNQVEHDWQNDSRVAGSITIVYDHHKRDILKNLTDIQHDYHDTILSSQHFHLDHDNCLEIIAVKGQANQLIQLSERLIAIKGILHGKLSMTKAE